MVQVKNLGFNLLEILISITILSIGILGIIALQIQSVKFNHDSYLKTIASFQLNSLIDAMRSNPLGLKNNYYDNLSSDPVAQCNPCSPLETAKLDFYNWNQKNSDLLPSGKGTIIKNSNNYVITIMWDENRTGATGTNCSNNYQVDLTCLKTYLPIT